MSDTISATGTPAAPPAEPAAPAEPSAPAPKPYTPPASQEELDRIIDRRLIAERRKYADYDQLKQRAGRLDEIEESQKTETERLRGTAQKANLERDQALARAEDTLIRAAIVSEASKLGAVDPQAVAALLPRTGIIVDGNEVDGVEEAVKQLLIEKPYLRRAGAPRAGAEIAATTSPRVFKRSQLRDAAFYQANRAEIDKAQREGRIQAD
jgi:hypothetical protein